MMVVFRPVVFTLWDERGVDGKFWWAKVEFQEGDVIISVRRVSESLRWGWEYTVLRLVEGEG